MVKSGVQGEGVFLSINPGVSKKLPRKSDLPDPFGYNRDASDLYNENNKDYLWLNILQLWTREQPAHAV